MENSVIGTAPKINIVITIIAIVSLIFLSFYGMYSNTFIFNRIENYIFPILALAHFLYLYVLWFKITEKEYPDIIMKNIEYIMYFVLLAYLYKIVETILMLGSQSKFQDHVIPSTFMPMGILILTFQILLVVLTIWSFVIRKRCVGKYNIDYLNDHLDVWEQ